ncbi:hypothetical protein NHX12_020665 [Muraenolepis orangiensis]|uniref:Peptidase S1 domain-containing protein n=1 Tax=Muraenolepis orangiensis TaxID=630683 RepID=A0A9Q0ERX5_9TELE|nr:hypothetical protein NHX12_020665 [Muraenolepis orangiensis]
MAGIRSFNPELEEMETRIIGGQEAWAHSWPWQVSLRYRTMSACGGAIISPLWVLTAAHCFLRFNKASSWTVMAGKHDLDNPHESFQQLVGVSRIVTHEGYSRRTKECDVALLKLREPLLFNSYVRPIHIWMGPLEPPMRCTITGWGSTRENGPRVNRLQEVNVTCLPLDHCNRFYKGRIHPSMFCAGELEGGVDACQGDSGGPLSCYTGERYQLAGVVSWGVGCGRVHKPGVYTKLQDHARWVTRVKSKDGFSCGEAEMPHCRLGSFPATLAVSHDAAGGRGVRVGGVTEACPYSWPWQVSLQSEGRHYCSGVLIHRRWVLAPHHCSAKAGDVVVLGVHDLRFMASQSLPVDRVFDQAQDGSFPPNNDLSLIRLGESARPGDSIAPICLPDDDIEVDDSWTCVTTGWGATKAMAQVSPHWLHQTRVSLVNVTSCRSSWGEDLIQDNHLCAQPAAAVSCMGDSGAPLVCEKHGAFYLFGAVTWGSRSCDPHKPAVFSSVAHGALWVTDTADDL